MTSGWSLSAGAFERLLIALDVDRDAAGAQYERVRSRLVKFFDVRRCPAPEDYADETLNRLARKLEEGAQIRDLPTFAVGVARLVLKESFKHAAKYRSSDAAIDVADPAEPAGDQQPIECLDHCLTRLTTPERDIILEYYQGDKQTRIAHRRRLSERLSLPMNALRIRAFRIREQLETCVRKCTTGGRARSAPLTDLK